MTFISMNVNAHELKFYIINKQDSDSIMNYSIGDFVNIKQNPDFVIEKIKSFTSRNGSQKTISYSNDLKHKKTDFLNISVFNINLLQSTSLKFVKFTTKNTGNIWMCTLDNYLVVRCRIFGPLIKSFELTIPKDDKGASFIFKKLNDDLPKMIKNIKK